MTVNLASPVFVPYMTPEKFADHVGVSLGTVQGWVKRDHVKTVKIGKRRLIDLLSILRKELLPSDDQMKREDDLQRQNKLEAKKVRKKKEAAFKKLSITERNRLIRKHGSKDAVIKTMWLN